MNILVIETSTDEASIALRSASGTAVAKFDAKGLLTESLVPQVYKLLADNGVAPEQLDAIAVGKGPGSYTGLRVGMIFGAVTAWTLGKDYYEVPTLLATAIAVMRKTSGAKAVISTANAYRHEIYARVVKRDSSGEIDEGKDEILGAEDFVKHVKSLTEEARSSPFHAEKARLSAEEAAVTVAGFGCETFRASGYPPERVRLMEGTPESGAEALLTALDVLGMERFRSDAHKVSPAYLRESSAELQRGKTIRG